MDPKTFAEISQRMMSLFHSPEGARLMVDELGLTANQMANIAAMTQTNNRIHQAQQRPPKPSTPEKPKPLEFEYKKRRNRTVLKRFPFLLAVKHASTAVEKEIDAYLEMALGPRGRDWSSTGSHYIFTKKEYAVQLIVRFRGTQ